MAQSDKLKKQLDQDKDKKSIILPNVGSDDSEYETGPIKIKPIECLNEFVAILVTTIDSTIQLTESTKYKNEGMVVGIGPGLPDGSGSRTKSQLELGDMVFFKENNIAMILDPDSGFYKGKRIIIISEKSLVLKLPPKQFTLVNER